MATVEVKCAGCGKVGRANVEWNAWKCLKCGHSQPVVRNLRPVSFTGANYVGGHSKLGRKRQGNLYVTRDAIGIGMLGPKVAVVPMSDIATVEVTGRQMAKSKAGAVIGFGVLGGLAAKGSKDQSALVVRTKSGETAYYTVEKEDPIKLRAKVTPFFHAAGIPFADEQPAVAPQPAKSADVADELRKLAGLRDDGILSEDEFQAQKAKLLAQ